MYVNNRINGTPWSSCQIRKIAGAHAPGMPGTFSPSSQVSDPDMHHGTCVTHVPWCMPGSLTSGFLWNWRRGETFPAIHGACATCNFPYLVRGPCWRYYGILATGGSPRTIRSFVHLIICVSLCLQRLLHVDIGIAFQFTAICETG